MFNEREYPESRGSIYRIQVYTSLCAFFVCEILGSIIFGLWYAESLDVCDSPLHIWFVLWLIRHSFWPIQTDLLDFFLFSRTPSRNNCTCYFLGSTFTLFVFGNYLWISTNDCHLLCPWMYAFGFVILLSYWLFFIACTLWGICPCSRRHSSLFKKSNDISSLVAMLPQRTWSESDHENQDTNSCSICLDPYEIYDVLLTLTCQHEFHLVCINEWIVPNSETSCPLCRHPIRETCDIAIS